MDQLPKNWFNQPVKCWDLPCNYIQEFDKNTMWFIIIFIITITLFWYILLILKNHKKGGDNYKNEI